MDIKELIEREKQLMQLTTQEEHNKKEEIYAPPVEVYYNEEPKKIANVTEETTFSKTIAEGMVNILQEGYTEDNEFREDIKGKVKKTAEKRADVETHKAELEEQHLQYQSELLRTEQEKNINTQEKNRYDAKRERRQFVYDGVKPVMMWVGIKEPMNIVLMSLVTAILIIPFIMFKPIGALLVGVDAEQRKKQAIAWLWTILALFVTGALLTVVLVPLSYYKII